jgi:hypothetical protein
MGSLANSPAVRRGPPAGRICPSGESASIINQTWIARVFISSDHPSITTSSSPDSRGRCVDERLIGWC